MQPHHWVLAGLFLLAEIAVLARAMLKPMREPASRIAWLVVILVVPVVGILAYLLLGEAWISRERRARGLAIDARLPRPPGDGAAMEELAHGPFAAPFALARAVNGLDPTAGNQAVLLADSNAAIDALIDDIDGARSSVHLCFYIWLPDGNGGKLAQAVMRAAQRGVAVRVLADALGSRRFIASPYWQEMAAAGADVREALPVGNMLWTMIRGRIDLRNHRKIAVIDNAIAWCGSQNAADPEFAIKARFGPWVDIMTRWRGPVARQSQFLFASDWMAEGGDDISPLLEESAPPAPCGTTTAQLIGTGPNASFAMMTSCFTELVHAARRELVITTPYFVPDEQLLYALLAAARRGVEVTLVLPARNDSRIVAAASQSHYGELIEAGVALHLFAPGLLHAKIMLADGAAGIIGSANLDRRSFELNFENNLLFADPALAATLKARVDSYLAQSRRVNRAELASFSLRRRLWQNLVAMLSPLL